jgi:hypothetical protein
MIAIENREIVSHSNSNNQVSMSEHWQKVCGHFLKYDQNR